jgi:hypothetical protein
VQVHGDHGEAKGVGESLDEKFAIRRMVHGHLDHLVEELDVTLIDSGRSQQEPKVRVDVEVGLREAVEVPNLAGVDGVT